MYHVGDKFVLSPTDITNAVACEFAVLRELDVKLGRAEAAVTEPDAMLLRTAMLGDRHEARVLRDFIDRFGDYDPVRHGGVYQVARPDRAPDSVRRAADETLAVLRSGASVIFQAAFFRDGFTGFADFIVRQDDGSYAVYDTKLARHAKVSALLQLAAYGDELTAAQIPLAAQVHLILGDMSVTGHELADIVGVYRERRARLEAIVDMRVADSAPLTWNDPRFIACGRCQTCADEVATHRDLLLVAGMRIAQRTRLIEGGVVTIDQLAARSEPVDGVRVRTFQTLRDQAVMQLRQDESGAVSADVFNPAALAGMPTPAAGDLFFDFEGDPLWTDSDPTATGLEYLFGVIEIDSGTPVFRPFWAHDRTSERQGLVDFLAYVTDRRKQHPGMHIYHYADYEKSALLRLAGRHGVGEATVDGLLADAVLVDLYALVRSAVRVSQPSYSLKKLEPLYMGTELRDSAVATAADSIIAYGIYRDLIDAADFDAAAEQLASIADYNRYDCVSTWRLRDWLCERAGEHGVELIGSRTEPPEPAEPSEDEALVARLLAHAGDKTPNGRSAEQQAVALLAASIEYHRREAKPFWWAHFDRLSKPVSEWADTSEVFLVERAEIVADWDREGRQRNDRRTLALSGVLGTGSQLQTGDRLIGLYDTRDVPAGFDAGPGQRGVSKSITVLSRRVDGQGRDQLEVSEVLKTGIARHSQLPMALAPGDPVRSVNQHTAIVEVATAVADGLDARVDALHGEVLSALPSLQLLARQAPRLVGGVPLPEVRADDYEAALTEAVRALDDSYLAVQGPPGSGKTYLCSRVIAQLVSEGWKIGVVAQSHKVVENVLHAVRRAGVDSSVVAKKPNGPPRAGDPWRQLDSDASFRAFFADHADRGCVLGGTAWDFTNRNRVQLSELDLLVVDEAGQFSLANTIAVATAGRRLLLLGDPQQLPQVSQATHPEPCDDSALGWLVAGQRVMPPDRGYFLAITWRMHPALTAKVSALAYDNELKSKASVTAARRLDGIEPGLYVYEVSHIGNSVESAEEAATVVAVASDLLGRTWSDETGERTLIEKDILVVAPFNAQVAMIRQRLDAFGLAGVDVGSVDKFQGQQAPVVIVSMTASAPEDVPRGMDFLLSRNRVNVAISRGQWCAIVIRSPRLTDYLPAQPAGLSQLGAFIALCS